MTPHNFSPPAGHDPAAALHPPAHGGRLRSPPPVLPLADGRAVQRAARSRLHSGQGGAARLLRQEEADAALRHQPGLSGPPVGLQPGTVDLGRGPQGVQGQFENEGEASHVRLAKVQEEEFLWGAEGGGIVVFS